MTDHYWRCRPENKEEAEKWPVPGSRGVPEQRKLNLEIVSGELALADLLVKHCGWEWYGGVKHSLIKDFGFAIHVTNKGSREGFRDLNALRQLWKELLHRGIWNDFCGAWLCGKPVIIQKLEPGEAYDLFNDPEGQVEAAIKVLRKYFE